MYGISGAFEEQLVFVATMAARELSLQVEKEALEEQQGSMSKTEVMDTLLQDDGEVFEERWAFILTTEVQEFLLPVDRDIPEEELVSVVLMGLRESSVHSVISKLYLWEEEEEGKAPEHFRALLLPQRIWQAVLLPWGPNQCVPVAPSLPTAYRSSGQVRNAVRL